MIISAQVRSRAAKRIRFSRHFSSYWRQQNHKRPNEFRTNVTYRKRKVSSDGSGASNQDARTYFMSRQVFGYVCL